MGQANLMAQEDTKFKERRLAFPEIIQQAAQGEMKDQIGCFCEKLGLFFGPVVIPVKQCLYFFWTVLILSAVYSGLNSMEPIDCPSDNEIKRALCL